MRCCGAKDARVEPPPSRAARGVSSSIEASTAEQMSSTWIRDTGFLPGWTAFFQELYAAFLDGKLRQWPRLFRGFFHDVQWKRCISDGGPAVIKFKMERLTTETGSVSKAVTFNRRSSNRGRMLAGAAVHGHGKMTLAEQRKRRMLVRSSPSVLDTDID